MKRFVNVWVSVCVLALTVGVCSGIDLGPSSIPMGAFDQQQWSNIKDGNNSTFTYWYSGDPLSAAHNGMGYDLGGVASVDSIEIDQYTAGFRKRVESVRVYHSGGFTDVSGLPDTDTAVINLGGISTSYVFVMVTGQQATGSDTTVGVEEMRVNSSTGIVQPWTNHAASSTVTGSPLVPYAPPAQPYSWNNGSNSNDATPSPASNFGDLIDNHPISRQYGNTIYNDTLSGDFDADAYVDFDLGEAKQVSVLGLAQEDYIGWWGSYFQRRQVVEAQLDFSNTSDFSSILATRTVTLTDHVLYQQAEFDAATARYVRFSVNAQGATNWNNPRTYNIGLNEIQLYDVPEPATMILMSLGGLALLRRRK